MRSCKSLSVKQRSHIILKKALERIQRQNPKFSMRALATKVGVSHVFMGKLLKGSAAIPDKKIPALIKALNLDELSQGELREALVYDTIKEKLDAFPSLKSKKKLATEMFDEYPLKYFSVLDNWYDLVLLDLLTCASVDKSPLKLARALGLTTAEVEASLEKSSGLGLAKYANGEWSKISKKIRLPTSMPGAVTRQYYEQVLDKIRLELRRTSAENFARRSITNISIAVNPAKLPEAKKRLQQAIYDIASDLAEGDSQEVYHLTTALIPVSDSNR